MFNGASSQGVADPMTHMNSLAWYIYDILPGATQDVCAQEDEN
jgi:hypothetical protein